MQVCTGVGVGLEDSLLRTTTFLFLLRLSLSAQAKLVSQSQESACLYLPSTLITIVRSWVGSGYQIQVLMLMCQRLN